MSVDLSLDLSVLEDLDFPPACGHSMHSEESPWHGGEAKFVAVSFHACPSHPDKPTPYYYPSCTVWAEYVMYCTKATKTIQCSRCGVAGYWEDMVQIVSTL
jgi:hypothetical protein